MAIGSQQVQNNNNIIRCVESIDWYRLERALVVYSARVDIIVLEGFLLCCRQAITTLYNYVNILIFVDVDAGTAYCRRMCLPKSTTTEYFMKSIWPSYLRHADVIIHQLGKVPEDLSARYVLRSSPWSPAPSSPQTCDDVSSDSLLDTADSARVCIPHDDGAVPVMVVNGTMSVEKLMNLLLPVVMETINVVNVDGNAVVYS